MKIKIILVCSLMLCMTFAAAEENLFLKYFKVKLLTNTAVEIEAPAENDDSTDDTEPETDSSASAEEEQNRQLQVKSFVYGAALDFPLSQFRLYSNREQEAYGFCVRTDNFLKKFPCSLKLGKLSASGGLSRLNNPLLTAASSSFSSASFTPLLISASLPSSASFSKPCSSFLQLAFHNKNKLLEDFKANLFYSPEEQNLAFSSLIQLSPVWPVTFTFSTASGNFYYDENTFSSWFTDSDFYYHQGKHYCAAFNFLLTSAFFNSSFTAFKYESPFGAINWIFRTDNLFKAKKISFSISGLYNKNNNVLTSSQKNINSLLQLKTGLQYQFRTGSEKPFFIKTGVNFYGNFNLSQTEHQFKLCTGIQFTSVLYSFCISGTLNTNLCITPVSDDSTAYNSYSAIQTAFDSAGIQAKTLWHFSKVSPQLNASAAVNPSSDFTSFTMSQKYGLKLIFTENASLSYTAAISNQNFQLAGFKQSCSSEIKIIRKHITCTFKLSADFLLDS